VNASEIALLGLLISTLVTAAGWIYTGSVQRRILRETTKSQRLERELAVFRERLALVRGITDGLLEQSNLYMKLVAMFLAPGFDFEEAGALLLNEGPSTFQVPKVLYDPSFRSLRDLLPGDHSKRVYDSLKESSDMAAAFHAWAGTLSPLTPNLPEALTDAANRAIAVARAMIRTADVIADAFAILDKRLSSGEGTGED